MNIHNTQKKWNSPLHRRCARLLYEKIVFSRLWIFNDLTVTIVMVFRYLTKINVWKKHSYMKKIFALTFCVLAFITVTAQNYAPWQPSQGPLNFMTLDYQNNHYVRLSTNHGSGQDNYESYPGIYTYGNRVSHKPRHRMIPADVSRWEAPISTSPTFSHPGAVCPESIRTRLSC